MDLWLDSQGGKEDDGDYDSESDEEIGIRRGGGEGGIRGAEQVTSEYVADGGEEGLYFILCNPSKSKMFQGRSTGRRLKRLVLKFGLYQLLYGWVSTSFPSLQLHRFTPSSTSTILSYIQFLLTFFLPYSPLFVSCSWVLMIIAIQETNTFPLDQGWFGQVKYGSSILNLTWCISFPTVLFATLGMFAIRNWPSLVTNRELLTSLLQIYLGVFILIFIVGAWCITITFLTFSNVEWNKISKAVSPYNLYVATVCFLLPYLATLLYYLLDLHYLMDSLSSRSAVIREPGRHKGECIISLPSSPLLPPLSPFLLTLHPCTISIINQPTNQPTNQPRRHRSFRCHHLEHMRYVLLWDTLHGPFRCGTNPGHCLSSAVGMFGT